MKAFSGADLALLQSFFAGAPSYTGGVVVGVAHLTGDARAEIVTGAGFADGSARVFGSSANLLPYIEQENLVAEGGVATPRVAAGRRPDGIIAILIGAAPGGGPPVRILDGTSGTGRSSCVAFDPAFAGGVLVG